MPTPLDPDTARLLALARKAGYPPFESLTPAAARDAYAASWDAMQSPGGDVAAVRDEKITGPAGPLTVRIYRGLGTDADAALPCMLFLHGGGWVIGSINSHDRLAAELAVGSGVAIASVHYRRAPETPFPGPCDDAIAALEALADIAPALGCDPKRLGVGGDSSGAHLAIGAALAARDSGRVNLQFQLLIYPAIDPACDSYSYRQYGSSGPLMTNDMQWFWRQFLGNHSDLDDARIAPLRADPAGLPPAYIMTAELDPLRDEGEAFGEHLRQAGVPTQIVRAPGLVHGFARLTAHSDAAARSVAAAALALGTALG